MKKSVFGMLNSPREAAGAITRLLENGYARTDITVILPDQQSTHGFAFEHHTKAPEGASRGFVIGGLFGAFLGFLMGIGGIAIPGFGAFVAAGPVMATLAGAALLGALFGLVGALIGLQYPELEARVYDSKLEMGRLLLAVHVKTRKDMKRAKELLDQVGAIDVFTTGEKHAPATQAHSS